MGAAMSGGEFDLGFEAGLERAAEYLDDMGFHPTATAIRTMKDGGSPCEDCGYSLPTHDPSCVSKDLPRGLG